MMIHANTQIVMSKVMERLEMPIPKFKIIRWAEIELRGQRLEANGINEDGQAKNTFKYATATYDENADNQ